MQNFEEKIQKLNEKIDLLEKLKSSFLTILEYYEFEIKFHRHRYSSEQFKSLEDFKNQIFLRESDVARNIIFLKDEKKCYESFISKEQ